MTKQFVSFERLAQYDILIKEFIAKSLSISNGKLDSLLGDDATEGSIKYQIKQAIAELTGDEGAADKIDTLKDVIDYLDTNGSQLTDIVNSYNDLAEEVGNAATETESATGLYALIEDLQNTEINATSAKEGEDISIVATLSGTVSLPKISLTYEFCTEEDIAELFALKTVKIGNKEYSSIAKALNDLQDGDTLTLTENITLSEVGAITVNGEATIDLNGKEIESSSPQVVYVAKSSDDISTYSLSLALLTLTGNGSIAGLEGELAASNDGKSVMTVEGENSTLIVLDGTYTTGGSGSDGMYGIYALDGSNVILGSEDSEVGPTITSWFAAIGENNTTAPANITVYGGTYTALATPADNDWWSYFCAPIYAAASGNINIYGGEFNGYYGLSTRYSNVDQKINIYGGTFNGSKQALFVDTKQGSGLSGTRSINIYGGIFSSDVSEWCAEGYECVSIDEGKFEVKSIN